MMIDHCAGRISVQALFRVNHHVPETTSAFRDRQRQQDKRKCSHSKSVKALSKDKTYK